MNTMLRCTVVVSAALGLVACASTQGVAVRGAASSHAQAADKLYERDAAYIAQVERTTRLRGVELQWVNPPLKRVDSDRSESQ